MKSISNAYKMDKFNFSERSSVLKNSFSNQIKITSLGQDIWHELTANTARTLDRLHIEQYYEPTIYILHQLINDVVHALHYNIFKQSVETDFGFSSTSNEEVEKLYKNEIAEHGDGNVAKFCEARKLHVSLTFPEEGEVIVEISFPGVCGEISFSIEKLIDALGYQLRVEEVVSNQATRFDIKLVKYNVEQHLPSASTLLTSQCEQNNLNEIFTKLSYSIVNFSSAGTVLTISSSLLTRLGLDATTASIEGFTQSIPAHFYNDVIWGAVLNEPNSTFENYRLRVQQIEDSSDSILFNVSGFRNDQKIIQTLWQAISFDSKDNQTLSEGSFLNEARVHNIMRNYVPQLVEQKARETVRLGGTKLINEECNIAVLFCDIVGFTTYVESNEDETLVIHTLNSIFRRISKSVKDHNGFIDKFMGDCIMALFKNPHDAVVAALEMQSHSTDINQLRNRAEQDVLQLRIGLDWGKVIIGNVGTPERLDWTTIGDVVNTASRIEKNCQPGAVLISQRMQEEIVANDDQIAFQCEDFFDINVKGKHNKLVVCYVNS
ncbi:MAG: adenylate/guanylate cyclase domain-containing protein [Betaproteobacteria bacterium]|nr:adenylate/guanylate cyclase domain-containing protein [Betaproteobacteria bacterium]